jgi:thioredoxin 1
VSEDKPAEITDDQFEEKVLQADGICMVDFWAPWCGPCHTMKPVLEAFAAANQGKVKVLKLDVDENPKTAERYQVRSIPTILFFRGGQVLETLVGAVSESLLQQKLEVLLR